MVIDRFSRRDSNCATWCNYKNDSVLLHVGTLADNLVLYILYQSTNEFSGSWITGTMCPNLINGSWCNSEHGTLFLWSFLLFINNMQLSRRYNAHRIPSRQTEASSAAYGCIHHATLPKRFQGRQSLLNVAGTSWATRTHSHKLPRLGML